MNSGMRDPPRSIDPFRPGPIPQITPFDPAPVGAAWRKTPPLFKAARRRPPGRRSMESGPMSIPRVPAMLGGWSVRAVPMAAVDPYFDALHLGGLLAVLAGSALLYWLAASPLSPKAPPLRPPPGRVPPGALAGHGGHLPPRAPAP